MEESDIQEIKSQLKTAHRLEDWTIVEDVIDYLSDFVEENDETDDD